MSEPRKNHLSIDGEQVKEGEHVASYKPIPETDTAFRTSKSSLAKSKEKISQDGADEKLLPKAEQAKIVTRVNMADAKYVVEDHRNGGAKIELDANKRQFMGLSKEELLKYSEGPFWSRIRWFIFVLFWAMWLSMLGGAITIIIKAPKCAPNTPRTWFEKGPLVDMGEAKYDEIEQELPNLQASKVQGIFVDVPSYIYEPYAVMESFDAFVAKAKEYGIKVIADVIPNYVDIDHEFFQLSSQKVTPYEDYFVWADAKDHDDEGKPKPPNNWVSTMNTSAWTYNKDRGQFYLHQYGENQPDLNFHNEDVVKEFDKMLKRLMKGGVSGIRLNKVRQLLVNQSFPDENPNVGKGSEPGTDHTHYAYWRHQHTSDLPQLDVLLSRWAGVVAAASKNPCDTVFTLAEEGRPELFLLGRNMTSLRPLMTAPIHVGENVTAAAQHIHDRLGKWPAMQLKSPPEAEVELASLALLLPAAPVLNLHQLQGEDNDTAVTESLSHLVTLRGDASVEHGHYAVAAVPARNRTHNTLLACTRWKAGHTGYVAVYNPQAEEQRANITRLAAVPRSLTLHHMSRAVRDYTNYTTNFAELADNILVPAHSTVVLSYVPKTSVEN